MSELHEKNGQKSVRAYPSASIILLRPKTHGFDVLMARRARALRFAPGAFVFPGGRVDPEDHDLAQKLGVPQDDAAYRIAALRELMEETGVVIDLNHAPSLTYFAHWITPPQSPKRFETKFYLHATDAEHELQMDGTETKELMWVSPQKMLEDEIRGEVKMMFPTRLNLMKLAQYARIADVTSQILAQKIITVMPAMEMRDGEMWFTIPKEAGYPLSEIKRENIFELMGVEKKP